MVDPSRKCCQLCHEPALFCQFGWPGTEQLLVQGIDLCAHDVITIIANVRHTAYSSEHNLEKVSMGTKKKKKRCVQDAATTEGNLCIVIDVAVHHKAFAKV